MLINRFPVGKIIKQTPLLSLDKLKKNLKLNNIFYKDESKRFHLKSFKALGEHTQ